MARETLEDPRPMRAGRQAWLPMLVFLLGANCCTAFASPMGQAQTLMHNGQYADALPIFLTIVEQTRQTRNLNVAFAVDHKEALSGAAKAFQQTEQFDKAIETYLALISYDSLLWTSSSFASLARTVLERTDLSREVSKKRNQERQQLRRDLAESRFQFGHQLLENDELSLARQQYRSIADGEIAIQAQPFLVESTVVLAQNLADVELYRESLILLDSLAVETDRRDVLPIALLNRCHYGLALRLMENRQWKEARNHLSSVHVPLVGGVVRAIDAEFSEAVSRYNAISKKNIHVLRTIKAAREAADTKSWPLAIELLTQLPQELVETATALTYLDSVFFAASQSALNRSDLDKAGEFAGQIQQSSEHYNPGVEIQREVARRREYGVRQFSLGTKAIQAENYVEAVRLLKSVPVGTPSYKEARSGIGYAVAMSSPDTVLTIESLRKIPRESNFFEMALTESERRIDRYLSEVDGTYLSRRGDKLFLESGKFVVSLSSQESARGVFTKKTDPPSLVLTDRHGKSMGTIFIQSGRTLSWNQEPQFAPKDWQRKRN
jgi:tetratricopeptide (TPR) repeat protein